MTPNEMPMFKVRRTKHRSDLHADIPMELAIRELVKRYTEVERRRVILALTRDKTLRTKTHSYRMVV